MLWGGDGPSIKFDPPAAKHTATDCVRVTGPSGSPAGGVSGCLTERLSGAGWGAGYP